VDDSPFDSLVDYADGLQYCRSGNASVTAVDGSPCLLNERFDRGFGCDIPQPIRAGLLYVLDYRLYIGHVTSTSM